MPEKTPNQTGPASQGEAPVAEAAKPKAAATTRPRPGLPKSKKLPPWKVVLHNDEVSDMLDVVAAIQQVTRLTREVAIRKMLEAHTRGRAVLVTVHREKAELFVQQFAGWKLTATAEPA